MIPIGDENWDRRRWPLVTLALVGVNVLVFLYETQLDPGALQALIDRWGVVAREYSRGDPLFWRGGAPYWTTLFTSLFLHGGWVHLAGNMLYLWIFGDNVEDRMGHLPFLAFYAIAGVAASFAQIAADPGATVPAVGASGAIAGVLGAYLVLFPRRRVRVLFFVFLLEIPAIIVIGLWALTQLASGLGSLAHSAQEAGGVAYMAHVGGFTAGLVGGGLWRLRRPPPAVPRRRSPLFLEPR